MDNIIAVDIECQETNLDTLGPGSIRKDGGVLSVACYDGQRSFVLNPGDPNDFEQLKDIMADSTTTKIMHNAVYDADWIQHGLGIPIAGRIGDTMTRAGLINEYAGHYDLDSCCLREHVEGKNYEDTIDSYWSSIGGRGPAIANLALIPPEIRDKYNKQDAISTYKLYEAQEKNIRGMRLQEVYELECDQMPVILEMRKNGIRIDVNRADAIKEQVGSELVDGMEKLRQDYGVMSLTKKKGPGTIPYAIQQLGLASQCDITPTGQLSVNAQSLSKIDHPFVDRITELKHKETMLSMLSSKLYDFRIGDRIHGTFTPTLRDEGGTITGRYSSKQPNMQNFASREEKGGNLIRSVFLPDEGHLLGAFDYKQIEYRLLAHFAIGPGSEQLRENIRAGADYHTLVQQMLGWDFPDARKVVKNFNFGVIYGMGLNGFKKKFATEVRKAARAVGMTTDQYTEKYYNEYFRRMTFVRPTTNSIQVLARQYGSIRSVGGRIHRLPPDGRDYAIVNYLIQGSAADILKMGLRDGWNAGVFNVLKLHLTVHDENIFSIPRTKEGVEAAMEFKRCMIECIKGLKIPIGVDAEVGPNWYDVDEATFNQLCEEAKAA